MTDERQTCPDDGTCHHSCAPSACFRVRTCEPLSAAHYPGDRWPPEVLRAHGVEPGPLAGAEHTLLSAMRHVATSTSVTMDALMTLVQMGRTLGEAQERARQAAEAITDVVRSGRVITVHHGDPDAHAASWCEGWDAAHAQGVGGVASREWVARQLQAVLAQPRPLHQSVEEQAAHLARAVVDDEGAGTVMVKATELTACLADVDGQWAVELEQGDSRVLIIGNHAELSWLMADLDGLLSGLDE